MADKNNLEEMYERLKKGRDELKVKLSLGKLEARNAWADVEKNFNELETKMKAFREQGEVEAERLGEEIRGLITNIKGAYERMRDRV